jgi:hypothetical protein
MATITGIRGRFFAQLLAKALHHYLRHNSSIDTILSPTAKAALLDLVAELPAIILALNPPGPQ